MRDFPLFIIDESRTHGRGEAECDFLACTSRELPFVASITFVKEEDYLEKHDTGNLVLYSDSRHGLRLCIRVVSIADNYDAHTLKPLLKRAYKEIMLRKDLTSFNIENIENKDVINYIDILISQAKEMLRNNPKNMVAFSNARMLTKIKSDYEAK
jgi:hypothetical protein